MVGEFSLLTNHGFFNCRRRKKRMPRLRLSVSSHMINPHKRVRRKVKLIAPKISYPLAMSSIKADLCIICLHKKILWALHSMIGAILAKMDKKICPQ
jgi:hypothetical protein